jgi:hypothetical protein
VFDACDEQRISRDHWSQLIQFNSAFDETSYAEGK